eukprot:TRINITY_DN2266_c0_g1_i6.p1 TRINITY_DN2266_c0_g1~~TRINITY_DN2266_c0_g1_i6.p1  ORF type:complete len:267 (+),score=29.77 TRINITY_DN2266_c0_g1_i6:36-836(+)
MCDTQSLCETQVNDIASSQSDLQLTDNDVRVKELELELQMLKQSCADTKRHNSHLKEKLKSMESRKEHYKSEVAKLLDEVDKLNENETEMRNNHVKRINKLSDEYSTKERKWEESIRELKLRLKSQKSIITRMLEVHDKVDKKFSAFKMIFEIFSNNSTGMPDSLISKLDPPYDIYKEAYAINEDTSIDSEKVTRKLENSPPNNVTLPVGRLLPRVSEASSTKKRSYDKIDNSGESHKIVTKKIKTDLSTPFIIEEIVGIEVFLNH